MASTTNPWAVCLKGSKTTQNETITVTNQDVFKTYSKNIEMAISKNPFITLPVGSHTDAVNFCLQSYCRVYIQGHAVAHETTIVEPGSPHKMDTGDDEVAPFTFITYVADGFF